MYVYEPTRPLVKGRGLRPCPSPHAPRLIWRARQRSPLPGTPPCFPGQSGHRRGQARPGSSPPLAPHPSPGQTTLPRPPGLPASGTRSWGSAPQPGFSSPRSPRSWCFSASGLCAYRPPSYEERGRQGLRTGRTAAPPTGTTLCLGLCGTWVMDCTDKRRTAVPWRRGELSAAPLHTMSTRSRGLGVAHCNSTSKLHLRRGQGQPRRVPRPQSCSGEGSRTTGER